MFLVTFSTQSDTKITKQRPPIGTHEKRKELVCFGLVCDTMNRETSNWADDEIQRMACYVWLQIQILEFELAPRY
jgi:hypothetical protein